ncbi:hypothetical protein P4S63_19080 [Pseudoalteromonas sp. B193]
MTIQARLKDEFFEKDASIAPVAITATNTKNKQAQPEKPTADSPLSTLINELLTPFEGYGLRDLNNANLMNRVDSKFMLPLSFYLSY